MKCTALALITLIGVFISPVASLQSETLKDFCARAGTCMVFRETCVFNCTVNLRDFAETIVDIGAEIVKIFLPTEQDVGTPDILYNEAAPNKSKDDSTHTNEILSPDEKPNKTRERRRIYNHFGKKYSAMTGLHSTPEEVKDSTANYMDTTPITVKTGGFKQTNSRNYVPPVTSFLDAQYTKQELYSLKNTKHDDKEALAEFNSSGSALNYLPDAAVIYDTYFQIGPYKFDKYCYPACEGGIRYYPHPQLCDTFFQCDHGVGKVFECADPLWWDYSNQTCQFAADILDYFCDVTIDCSGHILEEVNE